MDGIVQLVFVPPVFHILSCYLLLMNPLAFNH